MRLLIAGLLVAVAWAIAMAGDDAEVMPEWGSKPVATQPATAMVAASMPSFSASTRPSAITGEAYWKHRAIQADRESTAYEQAHAMGVYAPPTETQKPYFFGGAPFGGGSSGSSGGQVHVNGYYRKNGTYVNSYNRSYPHSGGGHR